MRSASSKRPDWPAEIWPAVHGDGFAIGQPIPLLSRVGAEAGALVPSRSEKRGS